MTVDLLKQREKEEALRLKRRLRWFSEHPEKPVKENPCPKSIHIPAPEQETDPLDDERIRTRLFGQRGLAMAESSATGERDNACFLYNRDLQQFYLTTMMWLNASKKKKERRYE